MVTPCLADNLACCISQAQRDLLAAGLGNPVSPHCAALARTLPLTHARTSAQFVRIVRDEKGIGPKLLSPLKVAEYFGIPVRPESAEVALGTQEFVFLYCGQFRYPQTQAGFLFATTLEEGHPATSEASPFDSGALHKYVAWPDPSESAKAFLSRHSLPVPEYREYLAYRLEHLFADPEDYLERSNLPIRSDPIGLRPKPPGTGADPRLWTFVVRMRDEVTLGAPQLLAVFYLARLQTDSNIVKFLAAQADGVHVEQMFDDDDDAFGGLQNRCLDYLRARGIVPGD